MSSIKLTDIKNPVFRQAVKALDDGNIVLLNDLLSTHPNLINEKAHFPDAGYFESPYLIYFVADNPIRNEKLPGNILDVMKLLIERLLQHPESDQQKQLEYTLGLVESGRIPRESGKQIAMMELLLDAGAPPGAGLAALAHGNIDAAKYLIKRGGRLTLAAAVCFDDVEGARKLMTESVDEDILIGLTAAAFYGKADMISILLSNGANPNGYPTGGFHTHATPLHQAVYSGNMACVKLLIDAGADDNAIDKIYSGTPLGWAKHMQTETTDMKEKNKFVEIENYLKKLQ